MDDCEVPKDVLRNTGYEEIPWNINFDERKQDGSE
jgi:hypothetical protein